MMKRIYSKRNVLVAILLLLVGAIAFLVYRANAVPAYLQAIYPNSDIRVLETDKKFSVDSREVYSKPVTVGDAILYMVVEVMPEQESRYKFYSADLIPQLLKEVSITTPFDYDVDSDVLLERIFCVLRRPFLRTQWAAKAFPPHSVIVMSVHAGVVL